MKPNMENSQKEYIQISKEDFEKIYKAIEDIIDIVQKNTIGLKEAYDIISEREGLLKKVLNKRIIKDLNLVKENIDKVRSFLTVYIANLNIIKTNILEKAKKEQIDKKENE